VPTPTNVVLANGGVTGTADAGDTLTITYSEQLDAATFCPSTWNNAGTQTLSGSGITAQIANSSSNDVLTISAVGATNCGGVAFRLGSVKLGGNYVTTTDTYSGTSQLTWDPTARTLTVKLGTVSNVLAVSFGIAAGTPIYTPSSSLKDIAGNAMSATAFSAPGTSRF
jgi:hypothetical protein